MGVQQVWNIENRKINSAKILKLFSRGGVLEDTFWSLDLEGQIFGLEANRSSKMPCPRSRTALFLDPFKKGYGHELFFSLKNARNLAWNLRSSFFWERQKSHENLRIFERWRFFRALVCSALGLGLERSVLKKSALALWFFESLTLASNVRSTTLAL